MVNETADPAVSASVPQVKPTAPAPKPADAVVALVSNAVCCAGVADLIAGSDRAWTGVDTLVSPTNLWA